MNLFSNISSQDKGQGLVEYGLLLALISVMAMGALSGVGDKVVGNFDIIGEIDIDTKVQEGYIPVASSEELSNVGSDKIDETFGLGTSWEGEYTPGLNGNYILVSDIDMTEEDGWEPIGSLDQPFEGVFDGGGHTIENLTIDLPGAIYVGLFGYTSGSEISNVKLEDVDIVGGDNVGGLVGAQYYNSKVINSYSTGTVKGDRYAGGLLGRQSMGSLVDRSFSRVDVESDGQEIGGLVGVQTHSSKIKNSYGEGDTTGRNRVGGLLGAQSRDSVVFRSYSTGDVRGELREVGGLVGYQGVNSTIREGYTISNVLGDISRKGLLVGYNNQGSIIDSGWVETSPLLGVGDETEPNEIKNLRGESIDRIKSIISNFIN